LSNEWRPPGLESLWHQPLAGAAAGVSPVCVVEFDRDAFDLAAFTACGIELPPSVVRSVPKRQAEFFFGRFAARTVMQSLQRQPAPVGTGAFREPLWPHGLQGSISHSGRFAAAVAAEPAAHRGIGIDIEGLIGESSIGAVTSAAMDAAELALLRSLPPSLSLPALYTIVFSAKESFFKGAFGAVGRYFDFSAVRVASVDLSGQCLQFEVREDLCAALRKGWVGTVHFGFMRDDTVITSFVW